MFKGYVDAEIDKLMSHPEFTEVLLLDETPPPKRGGDVEEDPHEDPEMEVEQEGGPSKRTRAKKGPKNVKSRKGNGKRPDDTETIKSLKGVGEAQASAYNLNDLYEVVELSQFLQLNGGWELMTTPMNGQCMWSAVLHGIDTPEEYREGHLRLQFVLWCCKYSEFTFNRLRTHIMVEYGHGRVSREEYLERMESEDNPLSDSEIEKYHKPGPFSFLSYLRYMMEPTSWGDEGTVSLISMMWNITITVVEMEPGEKLDDPLKFIQLKLRHSRPLNDVDLVLVLAGHKHYLGTCKYIFQLCPSFQYGAATALCRVAVGDPVRR